MTGGGTGTFTMEASSGVFTEIQPGSYVFHDADYAQNLGSNGDFGMIKSCTLRLVAKILFVLLIERCWEQSLFVLTTVMSVSKDSTRAIVDAGLKAVSLDSGPPLVLGADNKSVNSNLAYHNGGDEHGILRPIEPSFPMPRLGQKLQLIPGHCDPTVNMYDFIIGYRNNKVENVWTIDARSPGN